MPGFSLSKWYMDCVGDDGSAVIAYCAELRWGALALDYTSVLDRPPGGEPRTSSSLRRSESPRFDGSLLAWSAPALEIEGRWRSLAAPIREAMIFESDDGHVLWQCHQPLARAEVTLAGGERRVGLGYTERLEITLPPWKMPIDELRWGRFTGEGSSLVWIDWRGGHRARLVYHDGTLVGEARVGDDVIETVDGTIHLAIEPGGLLRDGALGKTALSVIPHVERLFPARILTTEERKWCARGTLRAPDGQRAGSVIHEVVRWR